MHIKFLAHGKGSPEKASAYLLSKHDHLGNVRAGVDVLMGDATTFNAICNSSPHLWKYTSGVIAWSEKDAPTDEQIREVLNDFEQHAFAGLDPSQYHLFAVQHTDDDGSKHLHVLTPRIDIHTGKSLNIAPPGHEKHFDSLRDYFNTRYQWSRPDDLLLLQTTQEPNHIAKLNKNAEKILSSEELESLPKKQFCKLIDNHVKTLLRTQTVEDRADIVNCIMQLKDVSEVKKSKEFITVTLNTGKKHRLKGDFHHENFEIRSYSEHLRAAAKNRTTAGESRATLGNADKLRKDYQKKRKAYHRKNHAFERNTQDNDRTTINHESNFDRSRQLVTTSTPTDDIKLQSTNRSTANSIVEYRYIKHRDSHNKHQFVFNINSNTTARNQQAVAKYFDRSTEPTNTYSSTGSTSHSEPSTTDRSRDTDMDRSKVECTENDTHVLGNDGNVDTFNRFISGLSSQYKQKNHRSTARNHSIQRSNDYQPSQRFEEFTEITHANRNRSLFDTAKRFIESTKQLVSRIKQRIESTSRFIKEHFKRLHRSRAEFKDENQRSEERKRNTASSDFNDESRTFKTRIQQLFSASAARFSRGIEEPVTYAIDESIQSTGFKQRCQQTSRSRTRTYSNQNSLTTDRPRESTLDHLAIESTERILQRFGDAKQADQYTRRHSEKISRLNRELKQLERTVYRIRIEPKPTTHFRGLRNDGYYPDYVHFHKNISKQQQQAYENKDPIQLIECLNQKFENIQKYIDRASKRIYLYGIMKTLRRSSKMIEK
ncbi:mobilization protein [Acinetobacter boissieri]|uniref:Relaxase/Mobilisation nuclease domain-containing protein n=1 Tax=Acinetobacter boissieri TaxID=1219383 RepID=A0A1G6JQ28_9GAMM|nr:mobilization protein [Acinetobacter boissieri]SDC20803.1 hypothetical protein SAMN05421733_11221 [Acinetobacter boissieri]